jgi:hypothetical protein
LNPTCRQLVGSIDDVETNQSLTPYNSNHVKD